jgi:hypothetical protein
MTLLITYNSSLQTFLTRVPVSGPS